MAYKMKGFSGFKSSPAKQKKIKNKGHMEGPIPEQNIKHQDGNEDDVWIYGRGYKGEDPKKGLKKMKSDSKKHQKQERMIDYDERAGFIEQNDIPDLEGDNSEKANKKRKSLKKTVKTLNRERQIMKDRTDK